jgi:uncharacterized protein
MDNKVFLFPLANAVLFKKVTLPYHIFEERYREMIRDAVAMQVPVGVIPLDSCGNYLGHICVAGLPHILTSYPDGRMDIYISGTVKCCLTDRETAHPYNVYNYRAMDEDLEYDESFEMELDGLRALLERWAIHFLPDPVQRESFSRTLIDTELLVNYCAVFLVDDLSVKRAVMEAGTIGEKVKELLHVIGPREISLGPFMPTLRF